MIDISFEIEAEGKDEICGVIQGAALAVMEHEGFNASVNITVVSEEDIRRINRDFRNIDRVTDVLSFPARDGSLYDLSDGFLGDIAICLRRAEEQAEEYGHSLRREIAFLTVHGMLHIFGYDHMTPEDEQVMMPLQSKILEEMGIAR